MNAATATHYSQLLQPPTATADERETHPLLPLPPPPPPPPTMTSSDDDDDNDDDNDDDDDDNTSGHRRSRQCP